MASKRTPSQKRGDALQAGKRVKLAPEPKPPRPTFGWQRLRRADGSTGFGLIRSDGGIVVAEVEHAYFGRWWNWRVRGPVVTGIAQGQASDETTAMLSATIAFLNGGEL